MALFPLENVVQNYAWGHPTRLAELQGRTPGTEPEAELWIGTHPGGPSQVVDADGTRQDLRDAIAALSDGRADLPFLLKILTIGGPLSIQVHPNVEQARAGFAAAEEAGTPVSDPARSYKDDSDKPEVVIALEPMRVLVGVLPVEERQQLVDAGQRWLAPLVDARPADLVAGIFDLSETVVAEALEALPAADLPTDRAELVRELLEQYPGDRGVLVAACMNLVHLAPGEALFTDAGMLHAYVSGTAVEIMNPSDNVLRAGLTPKHVDVPELTRILVDDQAAPAPLDVRPTHGGEEIPLWNSEVSLRRFRGDVSDVPVRGVTVALVTEGAVTVSIGSDEHCITAGHAAVVLGDHDIALIGDGEVYLAGSAV